MFFAEMLRQAVKGAEIPVRARKAATKITLANAFLSFYNAEFIE